MDEKTKQEFQELQNLEGQGSLDEAQKARLLELKGIEDADKADKQNKELASALAQKEHFRQKAEKAEAEKKALEDKVKAGGTSTQGLDVGDYIDISSSLDGLDGREKEYLAQQHKLSGKPLKEIRDSEDFQFWQNSYQAKVEKEKSALKPTNTQTETEVITSFDQKLEKANMAEKEKMLIDAGLYKEPRPRTDRTDIGPKR